MYLALNCFLRYILHFCDRCSWCGSSSITNLARFQLRSFVCIKYELLCDSLHSGLEINFNPYLEVPARLQIQALVEDVDPFNDYVINLFGEFDSVLNGVFFRMVKRRKSYRKQSFRPHLLDLVLEFFEVEGRR